MLRLATAAVLAPLLWFLIREAPPRGFYAFAFPILGLALWECFGMLEAKGQRPFKWLGIVSGLAIGWSFTGFVPRFDPLLPLVLLCILAMVLAMWRRPDPGTMLSAGVSTVFPVVFVGLALSYIVGLRRMPGEDGQDLLLLLFFSVMMADTVAYYVGSTLGRHRMAPNLSPKKSWEGAIGGLAGSVGAAVLAHLWFYQRLPLGHAVVLGLILGAAGILGDLAESVLKRATGVKDSSKLLPGHGGFLDRTDSLLFAAPILYYYYRYFLMGPA
jgi:phosphatidate cytidylyltransferase